MPLPPRALPQLKWERGRSYGIVIDAGSSGSRVQVYSWLKHSLALDDAARNGRSIDSLPRVEKGVREGDGWHLKVEPGISTFGSNPSGVGPYLKPLMDHALSLIPPSSHRSTPVYLLATAGMRLLPSTQQSSVLSSACSYLQRSYPFHLPSCSSHIRVISGEEEGLYGWIAVNYLMDGFDSHRSVGGVGVGSSTYGFLDMGGASTQIAFEPTEREREKHADNLLDVRLRNLNGREVSHPVFVTTWLGYGTKQARDRFVDREVERYLAAMNAAGKDVNGVGVTHMIDDPCLPLDLQLTEPRHPTFTFRGTGSFTSCLLVTSPLLNKDVPCPDEPCLFNGVHVPSIDFSVNHFIGISEYWYSTHDVWNQGGVYDFTAFEGKAGEYCARSWDDITAEHSGEGKVDVGRLQMQCFKAAWIINILHDGIGIPRLKLDPGGRGDGTNQTDEAIRKAGEKNLLDVDLPPSHPSSSSSTKPSFQSLNEVGDIAVSWTLGKMVLEVSRDIPPMSAKLIPPHRPNDESSSWVSLPDNWHGHVPTFRSTLQSPDPFVFVAIAGLALFAWLFFFSSSSSRRRIGILRWLPAAVVARAGQGRSYSSVPQGVEDALEEGISGSTQVGAEWNRSSSHWPRWLSPHGIVRLAPSFTRRSTTLPTTSTPTSSSNGNPSSLRMNGTPTSHLPMHATRDPDRGKLFPFPSPFPSPPTTTSIRPSPSKRSFTTSYIESTSASVPPSRAASPSFAGLSRKNSKGSLGTVQVHARGTSDGATTGSGSGHLMPPITPGATDGLGMGMGMGKRGFYFDSSEDDKEWTEVEPGTLSAGEGGGMLGSGSAGGRSSSFLAGSLSRNSSQVNLNGSGGLVGRRKEPSSPGVGSRNTSP